MRTLLKFMICLVLPGVLPPVATAQENPDPQALVQSVTTKILQTLKENKGRLTDTEFVAQKIEELIVPHMDMVAMSKLVLGKNWRTATPAQRDAFVHEFKSLLVRTYKTSLGGYSNQTIDFLPFRPSKEPDKTAVVRSEIKRPGGPPVPIIYSLRFKPEDGWKVYDIGVEGVSLVTNYRSNFDRDIATKGMDTLIATLKQRNQQETIAPPTAAPGKAQ
ncbi:MAG TPA: ABC transporter substrate-binding protein [Gammaproteobacteria bacterium]